jgi:hypothetical protein
MIDSLGSSLVLDPVRLGFESLTAMVCHWIRKETEPDCATKLAQNVSCMAAVAGASWVKPMFWAHTTLFGYGSFHDRLVDLSLVILESDFGKL